MLIPLLLATTVTATAQQTVSRFEVVSIKRNVSGQVDSGFRVSGGRVEFTNIAVGAVIGAAYQRFPFDEVEVAGAPDWLDRERFDIVAQTATGTSVPGLSSEILAMLRSMLSDRFSLLIHWEQRERDVYVLTTAKRGGALGPGMKRVDVGCGEGAAALTGGGSASVRPGRGPSCTFGGPPGTLQGNAVTVEMFGRVLGRNELHRPVVDRTGITGNFDIDLHYRTELGSRPDRPAPADPDAPSVFTAVEEQLGLKLVSDRAAVDVLVIDRAERPTPD